MAEWNKLNTIDFINFLLGADHLTLGGGGWGEWFLVIKNFFFYQTGGQDIFSLFFHKLSITFVLHAIFFFQQAISGIFFFKITHPTPPQELNGRPLRGP